MISDRGGEYYGVHTDMSQVHGLIYEFSKTRTLMNIVCSMLANSHSFLILLTKALKAAVHTHKKKKKFPSKSVLKTPYGIWIERKVCLRYMSI